MTYEMKEGDIVIFKNQGKEGSQPDYTGRAIIGGEEKRVALWLKESRRGTKFMSGEITMKKKEPKSPSGLDDEVPF